MGPAHRLLTVALLSLVTIIAFEAMAISTAMPQVAKDLDPTFPLMNAVKGMLQHNTLGADMLTRLRIYAGAEHGHQAQQPKVITFDSRGDIKLG